MIRTRPPSPARAERGVGHSLMTMMRPPPTAMSVSSGLIADKAFDNNHMRAALHDRTAENVISQHPNRVGPLAIDPEFREWRHLIENFFCKLKEFKRVSMRAEKTDRCYQAVIHLAAASKPNESQQALAAKIRVAIWPDSCRRSKSGV